MKKHVITIAGRPGSGKSTTAKGVAAELGYDHFSSGDLFRELAKEHKVDVLQANLTAEANFNIDNSIDKKLQDMSKTTDNLVIDSRLAWLWMPESFKVFLDLDLETAAQRILLNPNDRKQVNENVPRNPEAYAEALQQRLDSEGRRYKTLYNADPNDLKNYDLVVDTAAKNLDQTIQAVVEAYKNWLNQ